MEHDNLLPRLGFLKLQPSAAAAWEWTSGGTFGGTPSGQPNYWCGWRRTPSDAAGFAAPCKLAATLAASSAEYASGACFM
jgi:hypothetical protein